MSLLGQRDAGTSVVAEITLELRKDQMGAPVWTADGKHEASTAGAALAAAGQKFDLLVASIPGYGWGER